MVCLSGPFVCFVSLYLVSFLIQFQLHTNTHTLTDTHHTYTPYPRHPTEKRPSAFCRLRLLASFLFVSHISHISHPVIPLAQSSRFPHLHAAPLVIPRVSIFVLSTLPCLHRPQESASTARLCSRSPSSFSVSDKPRSSQHGHGALKQGPAPTAS